MPALFIFLLKVNAALLLFCAGYYLVLRHLTFYTLNRVYLIGAIVFATVYPQINLDAFFQRHQQLAQPVYVMVDNLYLPDQALAQPAYWSWLEVVFFAGVVLLTVKLAMQLFSLYKVYRKSRKEQIMGHDVRVVNGDGGPFSFWRSIYVNPTGYTESDLRAILKHEQIHTDEWHTIDILLAELSVIFYWFNPGVWLMRKAVRENIEFITDRKILQQGADTKQYQYSLLNVSFSNNKPGIANHFNMSTLKKRILMMNAKRSSNVNLTRYAFLVPLLLVMLLSFSVTRAAIVKTSKLTYKTIVTSVNNIVDDNPVTNKIQQIFGDTANAPVAAKKKDTIKVIRVGKKDTVKIITNNVVSLFPSIQIDNVKRDTLKTVKVLNFTLDSNNFHPVTRVRINGKDYIKDTRMPDSVFKKFFIKRDTAMIVEKMVVPINRRGVLLADEQQKKDPTHQMLFAVDKLNFEIAMAPDTAVEKVKTLLKRMEGFTVNADGSVTHQDQPVKVTNMPSFRLQGTVVDKDGKPVVFNPQSPAKKLDIVTVVGHPRETNINDVQQKLVLIDGKEATSKDLRKLSVSDVENIVVKGVSPELTKQYGDKAKNGVIIYITKKQNN